VEVVVDKQVEVVVDHNNHRHHLDHSLVVDNLLVDHIHLGRNHLVDRSHLVDHILVANGCYVSTSP